MKPKRQESVPQEDLFRMRLENLIDLRHALVRLAALIDWPVFEREFGAIIRRDSCPRAWTAAAANAVDGGAHLP